MENTYIAFLGPTNIAHGPLEDVLPVLKRRFDADPGELVLVFCVGTGQQVDFDLRGKLAEVLARAAPPAHKGPGRPRLGVTSREVTLLPQHWDWLEAQPNGASAALRRLVDGAMRANPERERARRIRAATGRILGAIAGNRPGYEEAMRALYAGNTEVLMGLVDSWPRDIRSFVAARATEAARADRLAAEK